MPSRKRPAEGGLAKATGQTASRNNGEVGEGDEEEVRRRPRAGGACLDRPKNYRVKTGDTLYRIAIRHGVSVAEILAINGLAAARRSSRATTLIPTGNDQFAQTETFARRRRSSREDQARLLSFSRSAQPPLEVRSA
jgi:hypothetical protein